MTRFSPWHFLVALGCVSSAVGVNAEAIEPRVIQSPNELRGSEGALLLSIRHQTPITQTMHLRFVTADGDGRELKFERKVGLGGRTRMLAREVRLYAVPSGQWHLASHIAGCDQKISADDQCVMSVAGNSFPLPTATYPANWFVIDIIAGGYTDAEELNLELPSDTVFGGQSGASVEERIRSLRFKARPLPPTDKSAGTPFAHLKMGHITVSPTAVSATSCELPAKSLKLYYNPFNC